MTAEQSHWPLMFRHIPSVYSSGPSHPGGVTSGQRPAPSFFENCTEIPSPRKLTDVIAVDTFHDARSDGEL